MTEPTRMIGAVRRLVEVLLLVVMAVGLTGVIVGRVLPLTGHPVVIVTGGSMEPSIHLGSAAILEVVPAGAVRAGDVLSFKTVGQTTFSHRVTRVAYRPDGIWFETKGDANRTIDPVLIPASAMVGRIAFVLPAVGYLLSWMTIPFGALFIVLLGLALLVLAWLLDSIEADRVPARPPMPSTSPVG